jgi:hypothetical protein
MNSGRFLRRREAAQYLHERGIPCGAKSLAKLAVIGGGPVFRRMGRIPLYEVEELDRWIEAQLSPPVASTTELRATNWFRTQGCR